MELEAVGARPQSHLRRREAEVVAVESVKVLLGRAQRKTAWAPSEETGFLKKSEPVVERMASRVEARTLGTFDLAPGGEAGGSAHFSHASSFFCASIESLSHPLFK